MDIKDYVQLVGILITFIVACVNLIVSMSMSKKTRHSNIASIHRKERIDRALVFYSKIAALTHPDAIKTYAKKADDEFFEKLVENYVNLDLLFDYKLDDVNHFVNLSHKLMKDAIDFYKAQRCNKILYEPQIISKYDLDYIKNIHNANHSFKVFINVEWSRLKEEAKSGRPISTKEWNRIVKQSVNYYKKWYDS